MLQRPPGAQDLVFRQPFNAEPGVPALVDQGDTCVIVSGGRALGRLDMGRHQLGPHLPFFGHLQGASEAVFVSQMPRPNLPYVAPLPPMAGQPAWRVHGSYTVTVTDPMLLAQNVAAGALGAGPLLDALAGQIGQAASGAVVQMLQQGLDPAQAAAHTTEIMQQIQSRLGHVAGVGLNAVIQMATVDDGQGPAQPMAMPPDPMTAMGNAFAQRAKDKLDPRNYEVGFKVGGIRVGSVSADGANLDTENIKNKLKDKAKDKVMSCLIWAIALFLVFALVVGIGIYAWMKVKEKTAENASSTAGKAWDGASTFTCRDGSHAIAGVKAKSGVEASANCVVIITGADIDAPIAIKASGNAKVTVTGGSLTGKDAAVSAEGNASVTLIGTKVTGPVKKTGLAKVSGP